MPPKKRLPGTSGSKEPKAGAERRESPELAVRKHKDKDTEFLVLCKSLHVSGGVCERAWAQWRTVQESMDQISESQSRLWGACLYVTVTDSDASCFTLSQLLKAVNLSVCQLVALVKKLDVNLDTISSKVNSALTRLEKNFDVMLALFQRFQKMCKNIFVVTADGQERETQRSCWTLFVLAKGKSLQMEDDLVISFQLLLCSLELVIKHCRPDLLLPLYRTHVSSLQTPPTRTSRRNHTKAKPRPPETEGDAQLLETLSKENECNAEEVKNVYQSSFTPFLDSLRLSSPKYLDPPQVKEIDQQYEEHYLKSWDIDGRLFFEGDETVLEAKVETSQVERTPKKNNPDEGTLVPPQTPIRAALTSIKLLRGELPSSGDQPSPALLNYFKKCTVDPCLEVRQRVETLGQVFSQRFGQAVGPHCVVYGRQRFSLGVRKYYQVMEAMLKSEEQRLSVQNFSNLLNNATFHSSLLACALEVVMAAYGESTFRNGGYGGGGGGRDADVCFPWILQVLDLAAFDFYKVIESFIKADPTLSKAIIKHLETCENLIMERIAWTTGSSLFELLRSGHEGGASEQMESSASFSQPLQHNHTAADLYLSPLRPGLRVSPPESPATPTCQSSSHTDVQAPRLARSNSLSLFYKKLYRLAYSRLKLLCSFLLSSHPDLEPIIWTLFQHTLQHEYQLMRERHLDQLMMSSMYAICKVKSVDLRFKTIVTAYKNMPNTSQETFKHVLISEGHFDSIIVFYNQVFMQRLKTNILQYASTRPPTLSPIPQIPRSPYKFPQSPLRVPGSTNVYVSPLKNPRMSPGVMTPRSKMLVSIGESFGQCNRFHRINQMVNNSERCLKRTLELKTAPKPLKRLRFDLEGADEADGSKSGGNSTLIQKLAEMSSTRSRMQEQKLKEDAESRKEGL